MPIRRPEPLPIETLLSHPVALALPASAFGALVRLALHFYRTDCRPLPQGTQAVMAISRASWAIWKQHQADIRLVLADWLPEIETYRRTRLEKRNRLRIIGKAGSHKRWAEAKAKAPERTLPAVEHAKEKRPTSGQPLEVRMWND